MTAGSGRLDRRGMTTAAPRSVGVRAWSAMFSKRRAQVEAAAGRLDRRERSGLGRSLTETRRPPSNKLARIPFPVRQGRRRGDHRAASGPLDSRSNLAAIAPSGGSVGWPASACRLEPSANSHGWGFHPPSSWLLTETIELPPNAALDLGPGRCRRGSQRSCCPTLNAKDRGCFSQGGRGRGRPPESITPTLSCSPVRPSPTSATAPFRYSTVVDFADRRADSRRRRGGTPTAWSGHLT